MRPRRKRITRRTKGHRVAPPREQIQSVLAKCYVLMAEVDYDLAAWRAGTPLVDWPVARSEEELDFGRIFLRTWAEA